MNNKVVYKERSLGVFQFGELVSKLSVKGVVTNDTRAYMLKQLLKYNR